MSLRRIIRSSEARVLEGLYAYYAVPPGVLVPGGEHFMVTRDEDETTIITRVFSDEATLGPHEAGLFNLIEISIPIPSFKDVGVLAALSTMLAKANVNVCIVSTFSKDYLLIFQTELDSALNTLKDNGVRIVN